MTERAGSRPSTVTAIVAPGAAALLFAATTFALHHSPAPAPKKATPVKAAAPKIRTDDAALARLRSQTKTADAELKRLRAQLAQVNSELAKAATAPIQLPRRAAAGPQAGAGAALQAPAQQAQAPQAPAAQAPAAPAPQSPAPQAPARQAPAAPAPPPPVDASTGAS